MELIETTTAHEHYPFMEQLMATAFPLQERREPELQRELTDHHPSFHQSLIAEEGLPVGLLTYWTFPTFVYIEHFAIDNRLRNRGYGQKVLALFKSQIHLPIVLEAEEPTDVMTRRRIGFYQRQGFVLQEVPYLQPPYRKGDEWFPLKLMTYGEVDMTRDYPLIRDTIYREVYQV